MTKKLDSRFIDPEMTTDSELAEESNARQNADEEINEELDQKANKAFGFAYEIHVAKNGVDGGSTGKPYQPFLTLTAAISYIEATFTNGEPIVVRVHPGTYSEAITLTRPRTYLIGTQSTTTVITNISSVTINPSVVDGGVYNSSFSLENLLLSGHSSTGSVITMAGTVEYSLHIRNCYIFTSHVGQKGLLVTNTSANKPRLYVNELLSNNIQSSAVNFDLSNCSAQLKNLTIYSGTATSLKVASTASALCGFMLIETSGTLAIELGATTLTVATSSITASGANASGASVAAGGTFTTIQNFYNISAGNGYAINGSAGGIVTHVGNSFAYNTNNKYKSVLTVLPHSTSLTSSA
jgi:hypothetical protein